jgi:hypothetical protein
VNELELYRVKDVVVDQGFCSVCWVTVPITVMADDVTTPQVDLARISRPTKIKELIRTSTARARQREGVHPTEFMQSP